MPLRSVVRRCFEAYSRCFLLGDWSLSVVRVGFSSGACGADPLQLSGIPVALGYGFSRTWASNPAEMRADVAQLVEHHLAKVRVAGSNPVVRSERVSPTPAGRVHASWVEWPRGEATDCKSVYTGSNPVSTSGDWRSGSALP